jgi:hypothetical protein
VTRPPCPRSSPSGRSTAQAKGLLSAADVDALAVRLAENPTEGAVIEATGGVRKIRVGVLGRGKRGGARVIYYYRTTKGRVYLLYAYAKNEAENLSDDGKKQMAALVDTLNREP